MSRGSKVGRRKAEDVKDRKSRMTKQREKDGAEHGRAHGTGLTGLSGEPGHEIYIPCPQGEDACFLQNTLQLRSLCSSADMEKTRNCPYNMEPESTTPVGRLQSTNFSEEVEEGHQDKSLFLALCIQDIRFSLSATIFIYIIYLCHFYLFILVLA